MLGDAGLIFGALSGKADTTSIAVHFGDANDTPFARAANDVKPCTSDDDALTA
jgi:hypothetical protein